MKRNLTKAEIMEIVKFSEDDPCEITIRREGGEEEVLRLCRPLDPKGGRYIYVIDVEGDESWSCG